MSGEHVDLNAPHHATYVLRVWYEHSGERWVWRAALRLTSEGPPRYFARPEDLLTFLGRAFEEAAPP